MIALWIYLLMCGVLYCSKESHSAQDMCVVEHWSQARVLPLWHLAAQSWVRHTAQELPWCRNFASKACTVAAVLPREVMRLLLKTCITHPCSPLTLKGEKNFSFIKAHQEGLLTLKNKLLIDKRMTQVLGEASNKYPRKFADKLLNIALTYPERLAHSVLTYLVQSSCSSTKGLEQCMKEYLWQGVSPFPGIQVLLERPAYAASRKVLSVFFECGAQKWLKYPHVSLACYMENACTQRPFMKVFFEQGLSSWHGGIEGKQMWEYVLNYGFLEDIQKAYQRGITARYPFHLMAVLSIYPKRCRAQLWQFFIEHAHDSYDEIDESGKTVYEYCSDNEEMLKVFDKLRSRSMLTFLSDESKQLCTCFRCDTHKALHAASDGSADCVIF